MKMKTMNLEPNWESVYCYMIQIKKTDKKQFNKMLANEETGTELHKLLEMAKMNGWDEKYLEEME